MFCMTKAQGMPGHGRAWTGGRDWLQEAEKRGADMVKQPSLVPFLKPYLCYFDFVTRLLHFPVSVSIVDGDLSKTG